MRATVMTRCLSWFLPPSLAKGLEPSLRVLEKLPPAPIWPSMLEVQTRLAVRSPSSVSEADPAKLMVVPEPKMDPLAALVIETVGALLTGPGGTVAAAAFTRP